MTRSGPWRARRSPSSGTSVTRGWPAPTCTRSPRWEHRSGWQDPRPAPAWIRGFDGWPGVHVADRLEDAVADADAVMTLRIQLEREAGGGVPSIREYTTRWGLDARRLALASPGAPLLHPGPTNEGVEITAELAASERSLIATQVVNGVATRMAVLALLRG
ncbi:MAG: hypothetical protein E6J47_09065 [Chloroflexi bacterium]|nr:MAG: hypothetical protein E6J47_09065 [Chloroflexota bacterium]